MNPLLFFRILLGASIGLGFLGIISEIATIFLLPDVLKEYSMAEFNADLTAFDILTLLVALPGLALIVVGYIGLFLLKRWGRLCFLIALIALYLASPLMGPYIFTGITYLFCELATLATGIILAMCYLPPVKDRLE